MASESGNKHFADQAYEPRSARESPGDCSSFAWGENIDVSFFYGSSKDRNPGLPCASGNTVQDVINVTSS
jgi:hypothetical protein